MGECLRELPSFFEVGLSGRLYVRIETDLEVDKHHNVE
jgi:hypothetical protein